MQDCFCEGLMLWTACDVCVRRKGRSMNRMHVFDLVECIEYLRGSATCGGSGWMLGLTGLKRVLCEFLSVKV